MESTTPDEAETRRKSRSGNVLAGGAVILAVVLILLFRPLAISYHRWEILVANKRLQQGKDVDFNHLFFHCEALERLDYAFHRDLKFDRVEKTDEAEAVLHRELNCFLATLPAEPLHVVSLKGQDGVTKFRVCDRAERKDLWIGFHKQHNVPDLVERFNMPRESNAEQLTERSMTEK